LLKEWIEENEDCPYPDKEAIQTLTHATEMNEKQVRVWFTNFRNVSNLFLIF